MRWATGEIFSHRSFQVQPVGPTPTGSRFSRCTLGARAKDKLANSVLADRAQRYAEAEGLHHCLSYGETPIVWNHAAHRFRVGDDVVGKVFVALGQDVRKCLICDGMFARRRVPSADRLIRRAVEGGQQRTDTLRVGIIWLKNEHPIDLRKGFSILSVAQVNGG